MAKTPRITLLSSPTVIVSDTTIDWSKGNIFYASLSANRTFTFSNTEDGRIVTLTIFNNSASTITVSFPTGMYKDSSIDLTVDAGKQNVYSFIKNGNSITASYVSKLVNS